MNSQTRIQALGVRRSLPTIFSSSNTNRDLALSEEMEHDRKQKYTEEKRQNPQEFFCQRQPDQGCPEQRNRDGTATD